jgi:hypothetical protein
MSKKQKEWEHFSPHSLYNIKFFPKNQKSLFSNSIYKSPVILACGFGFTITAFANAACVYI